MSGEGNFWDGLGDEKSSTLSKTVEPELLDDEFTATVLQQDELESKSMDRGIDDPKEVVTTDHLGSQTDFPEKNSQRLLG